MRRQLAFYIVVLHLLFGFSWTQAQTKGEQAANYISEVDDALTIRKVTVLPVTDNLDGIYARPIERNLIDLVKSYHQWDYVESNIASLANAVTELEEEPKLVQKVLSGVDVDIAIAATASKGPNGISIRLNMFFKGDGKLFAQEILRDHPRFEIAELKEQSQVLFRSLIKHIPYEGLILSRQQNRVTINLGKADGISKDQMMTVIQILKANRHPKFHFLISTEKEILGKVKILKVDDTLSFGTIVSERERGTVRKFAKVSGMDVVNYGASDDLDAGFAKDDIANRPDADVSFGKNPTEWLPVRPPTFGQVGIKGGLGQYTESVNVIGVGTFEGRSAPFYPLLSVFGELWINPSWLVRADITQGIISTPNPRSGSTPSALNHAMSKYSLAVGYNFLLRNDFFGPKLQARAGIMTYRMFVDDSQPTVFTTTNYSGYMVGLSGSIPLNEKKEWFFGGGINMVLMTNLSESPVSSGASSQNTINDFTLFAEKKISENIRGLGSLDFSIYSSSFSGTGSRNGPSGSVESASSISQRHMSMSAGVAYLF